MSILKTWLARAGAAIALAFAGGCATAQTPEPQTAAQAAPGPALWRLADEDTTVYLFGTVHALSDDAVWFDDRVRAAFDASDERVTEIDMAQQAASAEVLASAALLEGGQTLRALMAEEDRAEYEAAMTNLGLPVGALDQVEPWFAALNLSMLPLLQSGFNLAAGVDQVLSQAGTGKTRSALETIEEQVALFDELPMAAQLELLDQTVEGVPEAANTLQGMVDLWIAGDADGLAARMNEEMSDPELYQRLLVDRNSRWVDWIEQRLGAPGTVFIAVGAGHLAGAGSVQDLLAQRGYEVERIGQ